MLIFWCHVSDSREELAAKTLDYWEHLQIVTRNTRVIQLTPHNLECSPYDFQSKRRMWAEAHADAPYYILADDDCLPSEHWQIGLECLRRNPQFAIISAWPSNASIQPWRPQGYVPEEDETVAEHVSVGGIRLVRKGCMKDGWPEQTGPGYDMQQCANLRAHGYRVGYSRLWTMTHLGEGKTTLAHNLPLS